ncbi:MAG: hypothetical protein ACRELY_09980 [Polyangiaceae bacterium]
MIARRSLAGLAVSIGVIGAGCGPCQTVNESGPGATGTITSAVEDGRTSTIPLHSETDDTEIDVTSTSLTLSGSFTDAGGIAQHYMLELPSLTVGTNTLGAGARICNWPSDEPPCAPVTGTIVVRAIGTDCKSGQCAETIDADIDATTSWVGDELTFTATVQESGRWVSEQCEEG